MYAVRLPLDADEDAFRNAARRCLGLELSPDSVAFEDEAEPSLLPALPIQESIHQRAFSVPKAYEALLRDVICHSALDRFDLLYNVLWRFVQGERELMSRASDPHVARLNVYAKSVQRDIHKMHAFLRFRATGSDGQTIFVAWFEPQHSILKRATPFFVERFFNMDWLIVTPMGTAALSKGQLTYGPPLDQRPSCDNDTVLDELWLTYYRTTFNPVRLRTKVMVNEMPRHYWPNLPEAALIPEMVASAAKRVEQMAALPADHPRPFANRILARSRRLGVDAPAIPMESLRAEAAACKRCPLHGPATQIVFGEGASDAKIMFVGEQPGDQEDLIGRPFVGPAGKLFDRALLEAGLDRKDIYITNAVKHFKYQPRGKRRIHQKPNAGEVTACRWWLEREIALIQPHLIVALGGTAANALAGRPVSVTRERGLMTFNLWQGFVTVHPSYLLRIPPGTQAEDEYRLFVEDLRQAGNEISRP